jgi:hypothetical protein
VLGGAETEGGGSPSIRVQSTSLSSDRTHRGLAIAWKLDADAGVISVASDWLSFIIGYSLVRYSRRTRRR